MREIQIKRFLTFVGGTVVAALPVEIGLMQVGSLHPNAYVSVFGRLLAFVGVVAGTYYLVYWR